MPIRNINTYAPLIEVTPLRNLNDSDLLYMGTKALKPDPLSPESKQYSVDLPPYSPSVLSVVGDTVVLRLLKPTYYSSVGQLTHAFNTRWPLSNMTQL
jgi:hypothetical protein